MATKRKTKEVTTASQEDTSAEKASMDRARMSLQPTFQAAVTLSEYGKPFGDIDVGCLIDCLQEQTRAANDGDLSRAEAMLSAQAHTLDSIFNALAQRAINAKYIDNLDCYLKLALRAQSQSRATWEALTTIQNPPIMGYVRQANIAHGPQQVNNVSQDDSGDDRVEKNQNQKSKLLEESNGERLDTRTTSTAGGSDQTMAALVEIDRAQN